jgi:hypothetical protein
MVLVLVGAAAFGLIDGTLWSRTSTTASGVGNLSSTCLPLAFLAGWAVAARRAPLWLAAAIGVAATVVALGAFYGGQLHHVSISSDGAHSDSAATVSAAS